MKNVLILFAALFLSLPIFAQENLSWKKLVKLAEQYEKENRYADAAEHYKLAYQKRTKEPDLAYKSAQAFMVVKDYRNAAEMLLKVKTDPSYPMVGLEYARMLKQSGEYDAAGREFVDFLAKYQGADKPVMQQIVQNEIRGTELGLQMTVVGEPDPSVIVSHLGPNINKPVETEFAPIGFTDDVLYFSSTWGARARIYRSQLIDGAWGAAEQPGNFPQIQEGHYCNGTLAPDMNRFYFTICENDEQWGGMSSRCEIYVIKRDGRAWSEPERLRDYINVKDATATHPTVVHDGNVEILYFASNREGGNGGMDLWYVTRELSSNDIDFTYPVNLGSAVNTLGDEITPFYDNDEGKLYFASNGHVSIGGFDIFTSPGAKSVWEQPQNMGVPTNSPADDFYYTINPGGKMGFLSSNRTVPGKLTNTDEDIFQLTFTRRRALTAAGTVSDPLGNAPTGETMVTLYERLPNEQRRIVRNEPLANGGFRFSLQSDKQYRIEAQNDQFYTTGFDFDTRDFATKTEYGQNLSLQPYESGTAAPLATTPTSAPPAAPVAPAENTTRSTPTPPVVTSTPTTTYTPPANANYEYPASSPVVTQEYGTGEEVNQVPNPKPSLEPGAPGISTPVGTVRANVNGTRTAPASSTYTGTYSGGQYGTTTASGTDIDQIPNPKPRTEPGAPGISTPVGKVRAAVGSNGSTNTATYGSTGTYSGGSETVNQIPNPKPRTETGAPGISTPVGTVRAAVDPNRRPVATGNTPYDTDYGSGGVYTENSTSSSYSPNSYDYGSGSNSAPSGTVYRVQIIAVKTFNPDHRRYESVRGVGELKTEYFADQDVTRVMLGEYYSLSEARAAQDRAQESPNFSRAFIVEYNDGYRGRVLR